MRLVIRILNNILLKFVWNPVILLPIKADHVNINNLLIQPRGAIYSLSWIIIKLDFWHHIYSILNACLKHFSKNLHGNKWILILSNGIREEVIKLNICSKYTLFLFFNMNAVDYSLEKHDFIFFPLEIHLFKIDLFYLSFEHSFVFNWVEVIFSVNKCIFEDEFMFYFISIEMSICYFVYLF